MTDSEILIEASRVLAKHISHCTSLTELRLNGVIECVGLIHSICCC